MRGSSTLASYARSNAAQRLRGDEKKRRQLIERNSIDDRRSTLDQQFVMLLRRVDSKAACFVGLSQPLRLENSPAESIPTRVTIVHQAQRVGRERQCARRLQRFDAEHGRLTGENRLVRGHPPVLVVEAAHELATLAVVVQSNETGDDEMHTRRGLSLANDVTTRFKTLGTNLRPEIAPFLVRNVGEFGARRSQSSLIVNLSHVR